MPATTRPAAGLAARTAGLALTLAAGLTLTACGTTTTAAPAATAPAATAPPCRTASLAWTLSLLDGDGDGDSDDGDGAGRGGHRSGARLVAVNKGSGPCVFSGFPGLEIHHGKADGIEGTGAGRPAALSLPGQAAVAVDLRYTRRGTPGADTSWCVRQHEATVRAPHDTDGTVVPVTDAHGKAAVLDACGETIAMAAPHRTAAGS
ncbi:DUF4232 domain-containing protein [Streptomyces sp. SCL15-4]|uniref:DUF4232 domain-containing protein n=1 Tax=Streptomyces sp. SCL15-4 TaxID=2967221 RepID=UPI00296708F0|nr:DUF4232 domain-containing protein [Streptomyces sp. SCL15-4]